MKKVKINGFDKSQIFKLYDYLVAYEELGISNFKSTKAMLDRYPELANIQTLQKLMKCHRAKAQDMESIDLKALRNEIYMTVRGNLLLSFLAHLRNAIAHGCVVEHQDNILITDFEDPKRHPVAFTARGCVTMGIVDNLTKLFKSIEL